MALGFDMQMALIDKARSLGKQPSELTSTEVTMVLVSRQPIRKTISDGVAAAGSLLATTTGARRVPLEVFDSRKESCLSCPRSQSISDGIVCLECGCSGMLFESALWDPYQECRMRSGTKRWQAHGINPA